jgi:hypothetical protein
MHRTMILATSLALTAPALAQQAEGTPPEPEMTNPDIDIAAPEPEPIAPKPLPEPGMPQPDMGEPQFTLGPQAPATSNEDCENRVGTREPRADDSAAVALRGRCPDHSLGETGDVPPER